MNSHTHEYHPWTRLKDNDLAYFDQVPDSIRRKAYLLNEGVPCKDWFPDTVEFVMDNDKGMQLADSLPNGAFLQIVSEKLKAVLSEHALDEIEFIPIHILNHKGVRIESQYYLANVLKVVSCVDNDRSEYVMSALDKSQVHHFKHLFLDVDKIPEETNIFRLGEETNLVLVRDDLVKIILDSECSGVNFMNIADYGEQYRPVDRLALIKQQMENR